MVDVIFTIFMGFIIYMIAWTLVCFGAGTRWQAVAFVAAVLLVVLFGGYVIWLIDNVTCEVCKLP